MRPLLSLLKLRFNWLGEQSSVWCKLRLSDGSIMPMEAQRAGESEEVRREGSIYPEPSWVNRLLTCLLSPVMGIAEIWFENLQALRGFQRGAEEGAQNNCGEPLKTTVIKIRCTTIWGILLETSRTTHYSRWTRASNPNPPRSAYFSWGKSFWNMCHS